MLIIHRMIGLVNKILHYMNTVNIVPFHSDFSPSGEQPEHRKLAREL